MNPLSLMPAETPRYCCPGERHAIGEAIHLARLASHFPACRNCVHRHESGGLPAAVLSTAAVAVEAAPRGPVFTAEAICGSSLNELDAGSVQRLAWAWGLCLFEQHTQTEPPRVAVANDGRPQTSELTAAVAEGLRLVGCTVVDIGPATAGALVRTIEHLSLAGGLLLGNHASQTQTASIKLWGQGGAPWSAPGSLDPLRERFLQGAPRPTRHCGRYERFAPGDVYLAHLRGLFHGLRPLRFVLDTRSAPLRRYIERLIASGACQAIPPRVPEGSEAAASGEPSPAMSLRIPADFDSAQTRRRLARLAQQVCETQSHFGAWIDGDGEALLLVDQRGRLVAAEGLIAALARRLLDQKPGSLVVLEHAAALSADQAVKGQGGQSRHSDPSRQAMHEMLGRQGALFGGGPSGRYWFVQGTPTCDALLTLSLLLNLLSQDDLPLSDVLRQAELPPASSLAAEVRRQALPT